MEYAPFDQWFGSLFCQYIDTIELSPEKGNEIWQKICLVIETGSDLSGAPACFTKPNMR